MRFVVVFLYVIRVGGGGPGMKSGLSLRFMCRLAIVFLVIMESWKD